MSDKRYVSTLLSTCAAKNATVVGIRLPPAFPFYRNGIDCSSVYNHRRNTCAGREPPRRTLCPPRTPQHRKPNHGWAALRIAYFHLKLVFQLAASFVHCRESELFWGYYSEHSYVRKNNPIKSAIELTSKCNAQQNTGNVDVHCMQAVKPTPAFPRRGTTDI